MSKKKLLSLALIVIMIAILSFSTLAWFNDSESVTNKFQIATSADHYDPDAIFSVDLWEKTPGNDKEQVGHTYEKILPGSHLQKEANVENTGAYDQYIRVVVTLSNANAWVDILGYGYDLQTIFQGHDEALWTRTVGTHDTAANTLTYVYYLNEKLVPTATAQLFSGVVIPSHLTQEDMAKLGGSFELTLRADALQTENLGDGVDTAEEAFAAVNWGNYINTEPQA